MAEQNGEKTQDPTPHRRQQARDKGQVAKSQDLSSAALLLLGMLGLLAASGSVVHFFAVYTKRQLRGGSGLSTDVTTLLAEWNATLSELAGVLLPLMLFMTLVGVVLNVLQVGFLFLPDKLAPDFSRLDLLKATRRMFSLSSVARLGFGLFKVVVVTGVSYWSLYTCRDEILRLCYLAPPAIGYFLVEILFWTTVKIAAALLVLALLDYSFQRWRQEQDLRMTTQEVREEMKNLQGDPQVLARRRAVQRQLILNRMSTAVPKADVVITNPTELAVAIQYDEKTMLAPIVVAKGAGLMAQRIRKLALKHGIPIVEKKPLAQALYKEVDLNHPIPDKMYAAVAEVLTYVYQLQGKPLPKPGAA